MARTHEPGWATGTEGFPCLVSRAVWSRVLAALRQLAEVFPGEAFYELGDILGGCVADLVTAAVYQLDDLAQGDGWVEVAVEPFGDLAHRLRHGRALVVRSGSAFRVGELVA